MRKCYCLEGLVSSAGVVYAFFEKQPVRKTVPARKRQGIVEIEENVRGVTACLRPIYKHLACRHANQTARPDFDWSIQKIDYIATAHNVEVLLHYMPRVYKRSAGIAFRIESFIPQRKQNSVFPIPFREQNRYVLGSLMNFFVPFDRQSTGIYQDIELA